MDLDETLLWWASKKMLIIDKTMGDCLVPVVQLLPGYITLSFWLMLSACRFNNNIILHIWQ